MTEFDVENCCMKGKALEALALCPYVSPLVVKCEQAIFNILVA